jgi:hypothetical protein
MDAGKLTSTAAFDLFGTLAAQGTASTLTVPAAVRAAARSVQVRFTFGTGAGQVDTLVVQERALAASASETLDLSDGSLLDIFGEANGLQTLKYLLVTLIANPAGTTGASSLTVGAAASNAHALWLGSGTDTASVVKDGVPLQMGDGTGKAVDGTHKNLKVLNADGTNAATYLLVLAGVKV